MPDSKRIYIQPAEWSHEQVEQALLDDNPEALLKAVIAISMYDSDLRYAQNLCVRLSSHPNGNVRGNAVLGFGHVARVHRKLDRGVVQPIIQAALADTDDYVRGQAVSAADDTRHFLKWRYRRKNVL